MEPPVLILVGTSHPGNVGAAARGAANFGVRDMRFVTPRCDIHGDEAMDRAVHARDMLAAAGVYDSLEEALVGTSLSVGTTARVSEAPNHFIRKPQDVRDWAASMTDWDGTLALVFGREDTGLTREEVNLLDDLVTVPTSDYASLNLAHAVTLLSYECFRIGAASISPERTLSPDTMAALHRAWDGLTETVETRPWRQEVSGAVWRKMMGRARPSDHEVHNIMGILTRALKRFSHPGFRTENSERYLREKDLLIEGTGEGEEE